MSVRFSKPGTGRQSCGLKVTAPRLSGAVDGCPRAQDFARVYRAGHERTGCRRHPSRRQGRRRVRAPRRVPHVRAGDTPVRTGRGSSRECARCRTSRCRSTPRTTCSTQAARPGRRSWPNCSDRTWCPRGGRRPGCNDRAAGPGQSRSCCRGTSRSSGRTGVRSAGMFRRYHLGGNGAAHGGTLPLLFDDLMGMIVHAYGRPDQPHRVPARRTTARSHRSTRARPSRAASTAWRGARRSSPHG